MKDKQDLWELVRKKLDKDNETETVSVPNKEPFKSSQEEIIREEKKDSKLQTQINKLDSNKNIPVIEKFNLLNQGVFAGFIYILSIMIILGMLMIPGSITAAIGLLTVDGQDKNFTLTFCPFLAPLMCFLSM